MRVYCCWGKNVINTRNKMEDFKSAVVLLVASLASLTALLKLNMAIISLTKLAYRRRRNLLVNTMERMKRRRVFRSQTLLATKNRRGRRSMWIKSIYRNQSPIMDMRSTNPFVHFGAQIAERNDCVPVWTQTKIDTQSFCSRVNSLLFRSRNWNEDGTERWRSRVNGA